MSQTIFKPVSRQADIVTQEIGGEVLIYDLLENRAFNLNETSALVWRACNGEKTVAEIAAEISRKFKSPVNEDFVWLALEQLEKEKLLAGETEIAAPFAGLPRREVIRRVGFASLVALPVIASLIAPTAVNAQSGCGAASGRPNGCSCTQQSQCATSCCSSAPRTCVARGTKAPGTTCIAGCECTSGVCSGSPQTCQP